MSLRLAWLAGLIVCAAFVGMMLPVLAHDAPSGWTYPIECCSGHDCDEIASDRVKAVASGYLVDGKHLIQHADVKQSPDGAFHACFPTPDILRCFWAPPRGV
jgi:hypothetical protein